MCYGRGGGVVTVSWMRASVSASTEAVASSKISTRVCRNIALRGWVREEGREKVQHRVWVRVRSSKISRGVEYDGTVRDTATAVAPGTN